MNSSAADPVDCGRPYRVVTANDGGVVTLALFVGETMFTIDKDGIESHVAGAGVARDGGVRFHEKDAVRGKDVRVWEIRAEPGGGFSATSMSAF
jgi:hypothetical protein